MHHLIELISLVTHITFFCSNSSPTMRYHDESLSHFLLDCSPSTPLSALKSLRIDTADTTARSPRLGKIGSTCDTPNLAKIPNSQGTPKTQEPNRKNLKLTSCFIFYFFFPTICRTSACSVNTSFLNLPLFPKRLFATHTPYTPQAVYTPQLPTLPRLELKNSTNGYFWCAFPTKTDHTPQLLMLTRSRLNNSANG